MTVKSSSQISLTDLTDAYSVTLTSESYTFIGNTSGAPSGLSCTTQVVAFCGSAPCTKVTIGTITCPTGISATISDNRSTSPAITFKTTATVTEACEATIPITVDDITLNKKFSFAVAKTGATGAKGDKGATGATGKGVKSTSVTYQASTSGTSTPTGTWSPSIPSVSAGQYLWTRTIFTYTDNSTTTSYSVAKMGDTGSTGKGVSAIKTQYYLSTSNTTQSGGSWSDSCPTLTAGTYIWTRSYITWSNNTTSTTTPVLDNALNGLSVDVSNKVTKGTVSSEISQENGTVTISGNRFVVNSTNLQISQDGTINANNGNFTGTITSSNATITGGEINLKGSNYTNSKINISASNFDSDFDSNYHVVNALSKIGPGYAEFSNTKYFKGYESSTTGTSNVSIGDGGISIEYGGSEETLITNNLIALGSDVERKTTISSNYIETYGNIRTFGGGNITASGTVKADNLIGKTNGYTWDIGTENTTDSWVPVFNGNLIQHRVLYSQLSKYSTGNGTLGSSAYVAGGSAYWTRFGNIAIVYCYDLRITSGTNNNSVIVSNLPKSAKYFGVLRTNRSNQTLRFGMAENGTELKVWWDTFYGDSGRWSFEIVYICN